MKNILLVGAGKFGLLTAKRLNELGHDVMVIDNNEEHINEILPYATSALIGDATKKEFLEKVGVSDFDVAIVAIGDDFQNSLETTSLLKELGAPLIVARASNDVHKKFLLKIGADEIIYPEQQLAEWTAIRYSFNHIKDFIPLEGPYSIYEAVIPDTWFGKTLAELDLRRRFRVNVIAVRGNAGLIVDIDPDAPFQSEGTVLVIGKDADVQKCFQM